MKKFCRCLNKSLYLSTGNFLKLLSGHWISRACLKKKNERWHIKIQKKLQISIYKNWSNNALFFLISTNCNELIFLRIQRCYCFSDRIWGSRRLTKYADSLLANISRGKKGCHWSYTERRRKTRVTGKSRPTTRCQYLQLKFNSSSITPPSSGPSTSRENHERTNDRGPDTLPATNNPRAKFPFPGGIASRIILPCKYGR